MYRRVLSARWARLVHRIYDITIGARLTLAATTSILYS